MIEQVRRFEVERRRGDSEGVGEAISRVAEAGQNLVVDRLDLLKVEAKAALDEKVTAASAAGKALGLGAAGAVIASAGWATVMVAVGWWLSRAITVPGSIVLVGGVHLLTGLVVLGAAASQQRKASRAASGELRAEAERRQHAGAGA